LTISGWWLTYPFEKYENQFVSWDDDIPFPTVSGKSVKINEQNMNKTCSSHHQADSHQDFQ
jgi:hypothetical protein